MTTTRADPMNGKQAPFFTIFTPTFNRRELLERVYESLRKQSFQDFEWLIVDDGSVDDTKEWVESLISASSEFPIRYEYQKNAGKHGAHNTAIATATGFGIVVVDSDDWLNPDALEILKREWDEIGDKQRFVGVFGLFAYPSGDVVGSRFPEDRLVSNSIALRYRLKVNGDKIGFNRTDVLREFPFPKDLGTHYVSESLIWNRIARKYDSMFINQVIGVKEYQPGGITDNSALNDYRNPQAGYLHALELLDGRASIPAPATIRTMVRLLKCGFYARINPFVTRRWSQRALMVTLLPLATAIVVRDMIRVYRRQHQRVKEGRFVEGVQN
jgi:glycosyltransferase involved in cell wall biosynthesis